MSDPGSATPASRPVSSTGTDPGSPVLRPETLAVAAGRPDPVPDAPLNQPIVPASTYVGGQGTDWVGYGRYGNPGWSALEDAVSALEGVGLPTGADRVRSLAFASGMAAAAAALATVPSDATVVLPEHCYLGVAALAEEYRQRHGLTVRTVDIADTEQVLAAADGAQLIWLETPANPTMEVADIAAIADSRPDDCLLLVDNTFATPILQQPLAHGADIVLHSATKFLSGHSDALCGMLSFAPSRPESFSVAEAHRKLHGATPGVLEAYLVLRGIRTLPIRVRQAEGSARRIVAELETHPAVQRVRYPGFGSMAAIELADAQTADAMIARLRLWVHATSLGGVESSLERRRRWPAELPSVDEGLVRMSVGVEHVDDLLADLRQALPHG
ncbi:trans-sulfuration enzyme family protein [Microlunatus soli]|uniref:Cystathionine gamma-synthase n=1 Tax=Microlunatus soli TaxID=630515 RepID=A0A1H1ZFT4_9ACTN|nr:PLP-dependent aspartate aminotransferase family protein [Microlunatus soli]SDT32574.1 cystathionine gamma-synthase [Microlunatus soli]